MGVNIKGDGTNTIEIEGTTPEALKETEFEIPADRIEAGTYAIATACTDGNVLLVTDGHNLSLPRQGAD